MDRNGENVASVQGSSLELSFNWIGFNTTLVVWRLQQNLDEVRFWNYARTPGADQQNLYSKVDINDSGLFVYYQFNAMEYPNQIWQWQLSITAIFKRITASLSVTDKDWYGPNRNANIFVSGSDNNIISNTQLVPR